MMNRCHVVERGMPVGIADRDVERASLYLAYTGTIRGDEKP